MVEHIKLVLDAAVDGIVERNVRFSLRLIDLARSFSTRYHIFHCTFNFMHQGSQTHGPAVYFVWPSHWSYSNY